MSVYMCCFTQVVRAVSEEKGKEGGAENEGIERKAEGGERGQGKERRNTERKGRKGRGGKVREGVKG